jgi:hypothetical protein
VTIDFDSADLRPLIAETVRAVLAEVDADRAKLSNDQLAFPEPQAAALLGLRPHVLRDCRLRGEIQAARVGKRCLYPRESLIRFLQEHSERG